MAKIIKDSTPKRDGYFMPPEFAPQEWVWMIWPESGFDGIFLVISNPVDWGFPDGAASCYV